MKTTSLALQMLDQLIDEPMPTRARTPAPKVGIADMTDEEHRAYKARLQAERRAKIRAAKSDGSVAFNAETTRDALADAAIAILASGAPGADAIRNYLSTVFQDKPGVPLTVTARARSGELKTKLQRPARTSK